MVLLPENIRLEETSFPRLLLDLHRASFTGVVRMQRDSVEKTLQFHEGIPIFAESSLRGESLAAKLLKSGSIDGDAYARVQDRVAQDGCKEERALLDLDLVPSRDLFDTLKEQVRLRLLDCFGWFEGSVHIMPGDAPPDDARAFRGDFIQLLQEGIETRWSNDRILTELSSKMGLFPKSDVSSGKVARQLRTDAAVASVLDGMDGNRALWQVLDSATTPRALAAIWLLDALDELGSADAPVDAADSQQPGEAEVEIVFESVSGAANTPEGASATRARPAPSKPGRGRPPVSSAETKRLVADIASKFAKLGEMDHYALLGVDSKAENDSLKRAYLAAAKDYHPDTLTRSGVDREVRSQANQVFAAVGKAYTTLSRTESRREYDAHLAGDDLGVSAEQIAAAENLYRKGEVLLHQGNFRGALEFLLPAVEIYPDEADYQNAAGWALYRKSPPEAERGKIHLERAASLAPQNAEIHYRLGVVLRRLGEAEASEAAFIRSRKLDPSVG